MFQPGVRWLGALNDVNCYVKTYNVFNIEYEIILTILWFMKKV